MKQRDPLQRLARKIDSASKASGAERLIARRRFVQNVFSPWVCFQTQKEKPDFVCLIVGIRNNFRPPYRSCPCCLNKSTMFDFTSSCSEQNLLKLS